MSTEQKVIVHDAAPVSHRCPQCSRLHRGLHQDDEWTCPECRVRLEPVGKPVTDNEDHYRQVERDVIYGGDRMCVADAVLILSGLDGDPSYVTVHLDAKATDGEVDEAFAAARKRLSEARAHDAQLRAEGQVS